MTADVNIRPMTLSFAAIVPALNEVSAIARTLESIRSAGIAKIVVSDGGSVDGTPDLAALHGADVVVAGKASRGDQIADALEKVLTDVVIVVHADTTLPKNATTVISSAIEEGYGFGGFSLRFREPDRRLRIAERMINLRSRLLREPWGDQAQWFRRELVETSGFPRLPLMEDYTFARAMKRVTRTTVLSDRVETSGRRFLRRGLLGTAYRNWSLIIRYRLGADPSQLAREYRA